MATYVRDGSWRQVNGIYVYIDNWKTVNSAWVYDGSVWKQVHSTGTFIPEIRDAGGAALSFRNVGISMVGYRGYTASATSTYQWQYSNDGANSWSAQTGTGNSGTYAAATLTTSYTTDTTDVNAIENIFSQTPQLYFYMRLRVVKAGETQYSQNVRIGKRFPLDSGSTLSLLRTATSTTYTLTGAASERNPYPTDQLYWTPNFTSTTNITNDTRPDYYIFTFTSNSGVSERDSRILDVANPRNPLNSRRYTVQSTDLGGPIICEMRTWNSNQSAPKLNTITTRPVSTSALVAPVNVVSTYSNGSIVGTWDAASGGNDATINYVAYLYENGSLVYTSPSSTLTTFSYVVSSSGGDYRFYVVASQAGNSSVTSEYSNTTTVVAPIAFSASIADVTAQYPPGDFSIAAPTLSSTVLNQYAWSWTASTSANSYNSTITRPNGTTLVTNGLTGTGLSLVIASGGTYRQSIEAVNKTTNYARISWTKPFGTSAVSYRVTGVKYVGSSGTPILENVGDVTYVDVSFPYSSDPNYSTGNNAVLYGVTAYSAPNQTGVSKLATSPMFPNNYSQGNNTSSKTVFRDDSLALETPTTGFIYITGIFEPGNTVSLTGTRPSGGATSWSPGFNEPGWSHVFEWNRSGTVNFQAIAGATTQNLAIPYSSTYIGDEIAANVTSTYKGQSFSTRYDSTAAADSTVVPGPPLYNLSDTYTQKFRVSNVSSIGATYYYGTYSGAGVGTISETAIASTFDSPTLSIATANVDLYARRYVNKVWPSAQSNVQINSNRYTSASISISAPPQSTGQVRYLTYSVSAFPGASLAVSTNGYLGYSSGASTGTSVGLPSAGNWLNIATADLVQQYLYYSTTSEGLYIRWRGNRLGFASQILEYQVFLRYSNYTAYVYFIENSIATYVGNTAYYSDGSVLSTYSADSTSSSIGLISTGSMTRDTLRDGVDDNVTNITITAPAIPMTSSPTVTRLGGGYSFFVTDASNSTYDSAATYSVATQSGTGTPSFVIISGKVTVTGVATSAFHTTRVTKNKYGYASTYIDVQGQALAGLPAQLVSAPTITAGGTAELSGTVRRVQVGGTVTGTAGTYNNQQSIVSSLLTIVSSNYTGSDSDWTSAGAVTNGVTMSNTYASSSANMFRWRDRVTGTDASVTDFYSSAMYRAVYNPPAGGSKASATLNSITLNYTGGSGAPRWYKYRDGSADSYVTDGGAGPALVVFSGLSQDTYYTLALYGGNTEGYLSINSVGGYYNTLAPVSPPTITSSSSTSNSITLFFTAGAGSTSTRAYLNGGFDGSTSGTSYTFYGLLPSSTYGLNLYGYNGTTLSSTSSGGSYSTAAPTVGAPSVNSSSSTQSSITLNFTKGANAPTTRAYLNGSFDGSTSGTSYTFYGLNASSNYSCRLYGYDATYGESSGYGGGTYSTASPPVVQNCAYTDQGSYYFSPSCYTIPPATYSGTGSYTVSGACCPNVYKTSKFVCNIYDRDNSASANYYTCFSEGQCAAAFNSAGTRATCYIP
jgi:hypothetical protein